MVFLGFVRHRVAPDCRNRHIVAGTQGVANAVFGIGEEAGADGAVRRQPPAVEVLLNP